MIFDAISLQAVNIIQAHKSPVTNLSFNFDGTMIATASDKGTIIRVFSLPDIKKLYQFRRGSYPATIFSLSFNMQSNLLAVSSDTDTVHVFKLSSAMTSSSSPSTSAFSSYLPEMIGEFLDAQRDFAHLKLPKSRIPPSAL